MSPIILFHRCSRIMILKVKKKTQNPLTFRHFSITVVSPIATRAVDDNIYQLFFFKTLYNGQYNLYMTSGISCILIFIIYIRKYNKAQSIYKNTHFLNGGCIYSGRASQSNKLNQIKRAVR